MLGAGMWEVCVGVAGNEVCECVGDSCGIAGRIVLG